MTDTSEPTRPAAPDSDVARHYDLPGLFDTVLAALGIEDRGDGATEAARLSPVDEFHLGGAAATERLLASLPLEAGAQVLDLGSGIGGPARQIATRTGAKVTGIDLTPGYRDIATELSRMTGLSDQTTFLTGSATDLPFEDASFDLVTLLHVGMNIADKPRLMAEAARVLRPGGRFAIYDIMRSGEGGPDYPVPWAASEATSFLATPAEYRAAAEGAGLTVEAETPHRQEALDFLAATRARVAERAEQGLPPPPGVGLVMGPGAPVKLKNLAGAVTAGQLAPVELILRKPA